jgi:uncharacterized membrane protein YedE/YeeE
MMTYVPALAGGMLIGVAAIALLLLNGRIAGISGIVGRLAEGSGVAINAAFVIGLVLGPVAFKLFAGHPPASTITVSWSMLIVAGLLVGFGSRMGSGCTSGHGVLGLARLSPRSMAAVATFLTTGIVTVGLMRGMGL